jgi:glycopeptide antibiotics resistance protein
VSDNAAATTALSTSSDIASRVGISLSIAIIVLVVVPWSDVVTHSHWGKVQWVPFLSPPVKIRDIVGNVALYLPFGYTSARQMIRANATVPRVAALAALLSLATEWTQLYSHSRFPSMQDVVCNVMGAACGCLLANAVRRTEALRIVSVNV